MGLFKTFGENPEGERLIVIERSANYKNKAFENLSNTRLMADNSSMLRNMWKFLNKPGYTKPASTLPSLKTDLRSITEAKPVIIWFGHSSYFIRINEKNILVDPVLSGHASPFSFGAGSFPGTDIYTPEDFPDIDLLVLTHDHYDHLDSRTIIPLNPKVKQIVTSLGVGSHLQYWGFEKSKITELDWWEGRTLEGNMEINAMPARHFSGRSFVRNKTLWSSFIFSSGSYRFYLGGDSGYDTHFKIIGDKYGPFDIVMLESGQYNEQWPDIHMMPENTVQAAIDLKAKVLLPVHWAKFALSLHPWEEPVKRVLEKASAVNLRVTTPLIGEPIIIDQTYPDKHWWTGL
jgi:L-ascorbate metabolism protein UlaG (beta-lactamase superfamily)